MTLTQKSFFNFICEQKIVKKSKIKKFFEKNDCFEKVPIFSWNFSF